MDNKFTEVYAVPGAGSIIDVINPHTGLTSAFGRTEAEVLAREPLAKRMTWDDWAQARSATQRTPIVWEPSERETYQEMLNVLPPAFWGAGGFLVGEHTDHDVLDGRPRYEAYRHQGDSYFVSSRPLTVKEFITEQKGA